MKKREHSNMDELAFTELSEHVRHFTYLADNEFHLGNNAKAGYFLLVAERYFNELKIRTVMTAM